MSWFDGAEKLLAKVNEIHEKFIETQTEFRLLRDDTRRTLDQFEATLRRIEDKTTNVQFEEVKEHADLQAKIHGLELRLNALSEQALIAVAEKVAREAKPVTRMITAKRAALDAPDTDK